MAPPPASKARLTARRRVQCILIAPDTPVINFWTPINA
jgi:hypothetical protein